MPMTPRMFFIVSPVTEVRPSSVTDNLRGMYHTIFDYEILYK